MIESGMRLFLDACALRSALTLECVDPGLPAAASNCCEHELPFAVVGRDPRSDLHLNDPLISRRHAYLQAVAGRLFCIDLESRTRIRWDGAENPATKGWLEPEQFVWLGRFRICWRGQLGRNAQFGEILDPLAISTIDHAEADHLPAAELELPIRIGENVSSWTIGPRISLIGRSAACQFALSDTSISKFHASLVRTPLGIWVVDLLSREGVWVNGTRVKWAWLDDGDALRIGRFTFVLRYKTLPDEIARRDVPLDAGAIFSPSPVAAQGNSANLPAKLARPLADRSQGASRPPAQLAAYFPVATPLAVAPQAGDVWNGVPEFGAGPSATWNQHIQFLEMLHSEMILMVKMFMTMHREHVGSIRDELDRVQHLTRELEILRSRIAEPSSAARSDPAAAIELKRREAGPQLSSQSSEERRSPDSTWDRQSKSRVQRKSPDPAVAPGGEQPAASPAMGANRRVEGKPPRVDTAEFHAEITKRIAELQRERQGYWRRILSVMSVSVD